MKGERLYWNYYSRKFNCYVTFHLLTGTHVTHVLVYMNLTVR